MNAAAIDLGTNSIKLLIVRRDKEGHMQVPLSSSFPWCVWVKETTQKKDREKIPRYVQLRTLKVFQTYAQFLEAYKSKSVVRATGTSVVERRFQRTPICQRSPRQNRNCPRNFTGCGRSASYR